MYNSDFEAARDKVIGINRERTKIGTLSEKSQHAILKYYFVPDSDSHEIKLGSFYADAVGEDGIVEVQTRAAYRLKKKLMYFLAVSDVTLVMPCVYERRLMWIDPETGEQTEGRKSTKKGRLCELFHELYGIVDLLDNPRLHICVMQMNVTDYKLLNGYGEKKKIKAQKFDRIPDEIVRELYLNTPEDYLELLPDMPEGEFTAAEAAKAAKMKSQMTYSMIHVLEKMNLAEECGVRGRAKVYRLL